jgi:hypothetical protein
MLRIWFRPNDRDQGSGFRVQEQQGKARGFRRKGLGKRVQGSGKKGGNE